MTVEKFIETTDITQDELYHLKYGVEAVKYQTAHSGNDSALSMSLSNSCFVLITLKNGEIAVVKIPPPTSLTDAYSAKKFLAKKGIWTAL